MRRILRPRIVNGVIAIVTGILVVGYLLDYSGTGEPPGLDPDRQPTTPHPDYFLRQSTSTEFDEQGQLEFRLSSDAVEHNPKDDSAQLQSPRFKLYKDGSLNWTVNARFGVISGDRERLDLEQRVVVSSRDGETVLKTPRLTLFPEQKLAETDKPVTLRNPNGFTRSIGLTADLNTERIDLLQQVRSQFQGVLFKDER